MEIDDEIFSRVILTFSVIQEGLVSITSESMFTKYWLFAYQACPGKSVLKLTDRQNMTIAVDWDIKPQTKQNSYANTLKDIHQSFKFAEN